MEDDSLLIVVADFDLIQKIEWAGGSLRVILAKECTDDVLWR
jgi:hypothetical protein